MTNNALYWFLARIIGWLIWGGEVLDRENLPDDFPVVFVSNQAAPFGPIGITASLPVRVHHWVVSDLMERDRAPDYLLKNCIKPYSGAAPAFEALLSTLVSWLSVPLLSAMGCVPVRPGEGLRETFRVSQEHLAAGRSLLIFPEDPNGVMDELFMMRPFKKGFTRLGEMYYEHTRQILRFYPLAVNLAARRVKVGRPVSYNPYNNVVRERIRIKRSLEAAVHSLYLSIILDEYAGIPLPY